jgi:hypothetical protein
MRTPLALALLLASCASVQPRVGDVPRVSATHYQSMAGVKLAGDAGPMTCNRESITGSHILRWYCRLGDDPAQYELGRRIMLDLRSPY